METAVTAEYTKQRELVLNKNQFYYKFADPGAIKPPPRRREKNAPVTAMSEIKKPKHESLIYIFRSIQKRKYWKGR